MAEEQGDVVEKVETQEQQTSKVATPEVDYKAEYEKSKKEIDELKSTNAGLDRKIGELSNSFNEYRTAKETDEERRQREAEERKKADQDKLKDLTDRETKILEQENKWALRGIAKNLEIDDSVIDELGFTTEAQLKNYAGILQAERERASQSTATEIRNKFSGKREELNNNSGSTSPYSSYVKEMLDS